MKKAFVNKPPVIVNKIVKRKKKRKEGKPARTVVAKKKSQMQKVEKELNLKQELFCQLYVKNRAMFGNATQCYAQAYGYDFESMSDEKPVTETKTVKRFDQLAGEVVDEVVPAKWGKSEKELAYEVCMVAGSTLLRNIKVNDRVKALFLELVSEEAADTELGWLMQQRDELTPKMAAIKEFNAVRGRVQQKVDHTHKFIGVVKHIYGKSRQINTNRKLDGRTN